MLTQTRDNNVLLLIKSTIDKIKDLESFEFHKSIAKRQRICYNKFRKDPSLLKDKLLIELDYKSKTRLGVGPRQENQKFYLSAKKVS